MRSYSSQPLKSSIQKAPNKAARIQNNEEETAERNSLDILLYEWAVARFCVELSDAGLIHLASNGVCNGTGFQGLNSTTGVSIKGKDRLNQPSTTPDTRDITGVRRALDHTTHPNLDGQPRARADSS